jgi:hypothetical protein
MDGRGVTAAFAGDDCSRFVGTTIGERLGSIYLRDGKQRGHVFLIRIGLAAAALGIAAKVAVKVIKHSGQLAAVHPDAMRLLSSYQKFPPSPTYVILYAGVGLLIIAAIFEAERQGHMKFVLGQLRNLGEASLFVYALQFYVYSVVLRDLTLPYSPLWPIGFLVTIEFLAVCATLWNARQGNRLLTVGLTSALSRRASRRRPPPSRGQENLAPVPFSTTAIRGSVRSA